jgi:uncharacterized protein involved in outer membrane biogenesis
MNSSRVICRSLGWTAAVLAAAVLLTGGLAVAIDLGYGRTLLVRYIASRAGRPIEVKGVLRTQLLSLRPRLIAEQVTIGNPPWVPAGTIARVGRLSAVFKLPGFDHPGGIIELELQSASLNLARDALGRANWQVTDPAKGRVEKNSPIIRVLSMPGAQVVLADAQRHLNFVGTVSVADPVGSGTPPPLRLEGSGQLNGRPISLQLTADPLATASHRKPYHFSYAERSGDSHVEGTGVLPQPFAFDIVDTLFAAAGPDLKDLYFLTGISLLDTGPYTLSGTLSRRITRTVFSPLQVTSAGSEMHGSVSIDSASGMPQFDLDLNSRMLRLSDLGARAAGRATGDDPPLLLSNAMLSLNVLRTGATKVKFHANQVEVGHLALQAVSAAATIDHAVLKIAPLVADALGGHISASLTLDATHDPPAAQANLTITDLQLQKFAKKDPEHPPVAGAAQVRIEVTGSGTSLHQVAASANGTVKVQVPHGAIRESLAELSGIDLRGLGLLLAKDKQEIPVNCAVATFAAHDGLLTAQNLVADTDSVLITGEGQVHLDSEALDLHIHGQPKHLRLFRLRAPVLVHGTLLHPSVGVEGAKPTLHIIDPGKATNADCAALLAQAAR